MRKITFGIIVAALTASAAMPAAQAQGVAVLFVPPFTEQVTGLSALRLPCEIGDAGVPATASDPATSTFQPLSAGVTVTGCSLHGRSEYRQWDLGEVLPLLAGQPAQVIAIFDGEASAMASGSGTGLSASLQVRLGDDGVEGGWQTIVSASCAGDGCGGHSRSGPFVFAADLDALPATLYATFLSETHAEDATGHAEAVFTGALTQLIIRPLE